MPDTATLEHPRPGRPSSGADERILQAAFEVLERDGYAGLTTAKVATLSGHNKALIAYHFGSKQGLVAKVTKRVGEQFSRELLAEIGEPRTVGELARRLVNALWSYIERHGGQARIYFDLASQSMVDPEISVITAIIRDSHRELLEELLAGLDDGPRPARREAAVIYLVASLEGLALERLGRSDGDTVEQAAEMFVRSAPVAISR